MQYLCGLKPFGAIPNKRQLNHLEIGKKAFFHFGMNTFTDIEWGNGKEDASLFNPSKVDCRQWIRVIKSAGFELAILTVKHHDGFCLWPSEYTEHSIKNSPYKNGKGDIVKEFTDACHEYGIKAGIYISPWDRHAPGWGKPEYNDFYVNQLTELLTNYGSLDEIWWDAAGSGDTPYDWGKWAYIIRNYQPNAAVFGARGATPYVDFRWVGNESGFAGDPCYPTIDEEMLFVENTNVLNSGMINGERFIPAEVDVSTRPGWFYHKNQDDDVKSIEKMIRIWYTSIGRGSMLLMNFPPDRNGVIPDKDANNAIKANEYITKMMSVNLASNGIATSSEERCCQYEAQNILLNNKDCFFSASDDAKNVTINIKLPEKRIFNTFTIREKLELGVRVCGYKVSALIDGNWVLLKDKKSIGYMWAEYCGDVCSNEIKIEFYEFLAPPVIESFGLHYIDINPYEEQIATTTAKNLVKNIEYSEKTAVASFGGIYPFNTIAFTGKGVAVYTIEAFDGTNFYEIYRGARPEEKEIVHLKETIDGSYQIRFTSVTNISENLEIEVFNL